MTTSLGSAADAPFPVGLASTHCRYPLGWSLYGRLDEAVFRQIVLILLLLSGLAIVGTGHFAAA
jgi:hypothetical protein